MQNNASFLIADHARDQILNIGEYLGGNQPQKLLNWLANVRDTVVELAAQPNLGMAFSLPESQLHSLRRFRVRNHRAYWIYYRPFASSNGIEVFAVLHERQNAGEQLQESLEA